MDLPECAVNRGGKYSVSETDDGGALVGVYFAAPSEGVCFGSWDLPAYTYPCAFREVVLQTVGSLSLFGFGSVVSSLCFHIHLQPSKLPSSTKFLFLLLIGQNEGSHICPLRSLEALQSQQSLWSLRCGLNSFAEIVLVQSCNVSEMGICRSRPDGQVALSSPNRCCS